MNQGLLKHVILYNVYTAVNEYTCTCMFNVIARTVPTVYILKVWVI